MSRSHLNFKWHGWGDLWYRVRYNWRFLFCIFIPILLSPITVIPTNPPPPKSNATTTTTEASTIQSQTRAVPPTSIGITSTIGTTTGTVAQITSESTTAMDVNSSTSVPISIIRQLNDASIFTANLSQPNATARSKAFGRATGRRGPPSAASYQDDPSKKYRCAYVIACMAFFFVFEVTPMAITSLFPLVFFPLLGVQKACEVSKNYMKESNMIFLGSIIIALAIEYSGLHIRGALKVIGIFGAKPHRIMLGTMIFTAFLSMWLSDTSCTTMILPILMAIVSCMFQEEQTEPLNKEERCAVRRSIEMGIPPGLSQFRERRESHVFQNSSMSTDTQQFAVRRRSRLSSDYGQSGHGHLPGSLHHMSPMSSLGRMARHAPSDRSIPHLQSSSLHSATIAEAIPEGDEGEGDKSRSRIVLQNSQTGIDNKGFEGGNEKEVVAESKEEERINTPEEKDSLQDINVQEKIRKMLLLAVAYSANIGGTGSLVGTGPIKVFKELNKEHEDKTDSSLHISFLTFMGFTLPAIAVNICIVWFYLTWRYYGVKNFFQKSAPIVSKREREKVRKYLAEESKRQGPMGAHQIGVLVVAILVVVLWLGRDPQFMPGWSDFEKVKKSGDSTSAMFAVLLLFMIPRRWDFLDFKKVFIAPLKYEPLLDWKFVCSNAPWGYVLLIGSGYAISDAAEYSGLSAYIGDELEYLNKLGKRLLLLVVMIVTSVLTEVVSNTACATLILPILFGVSCKLQLHPSYLTMASAISASYAFMLPISSPPNAIVFATGELTVKEMMANGLVLNIICTSTLYLAFISYGDLMFGFLGNSTNINCGENLYLC